LKASFARATAAAAVAGVAGVSAAISSPVTGEKLGIVPAVVRDAVGDRAPGPHESNLFDLQAKYAEVIDLATARRYLAGLE
jgi:hypothetical protein